ncbi:MAG: DmsC/YnfH family molybdoenzyme membrane anchor subunit [Casimicrobiaceae bacterium]
MKPTFSIIFFTVVSGAGLGLLSLLALADLYPARPLPRHALTTGVALALALISIGLASSVLHLAKPSNAWRAFSRFRTSWLSREAVFSAALGAVTLAYGWCMAAGVSGVPRVAFAVIVCALACTVIYCTAMIYASLKPIRQWHTRWTPANYLLLGHWSGALLLLAVATAYGADPVPFAWLAAGIGSVALVVKLAYWRALRDDSAAPTLERAIGVREGVRPPGVSVAQARLFDVGHSHGTFLTNEFGFTLARRHATALRSAALALGFGLPALAIAVDARGAALLFTVAALCMVGLLAERWLFFAEARHTVRLYHGDARA